MKKVLILPALLLVLGTAKGEEGDSTSQAAPSQNEELSKLKGSLDGLNESYLETKATVDALAKIKMSGYIQAQWQHSDSIGGPSKAGGNFPINTDRRFLIRRSRLKTAYETPTSKYSLEIEALPTGVVLKDVEIAMMEPWLKTFSLVLGVMDRPFGFEIPYSSSLIETPERTRFEQTYFNGEKDLGGELVIAPGSDMGMLQYLNFKGGLFRGQGGSTPSLDEIDREMDFIGRLGFKAPLPDLGLDIDGGFSAYIGTVEDASDTALVMGDTSFVKSTGHRLEQYDRKVYDVDGQLYYDIPFIGGTSLRFEYEWGTMPSNQGAAAPYFPTTAIGPNTPAATAGTPNLQVRNISGWYITWVQNLGSKVQGVLRYDVYDPNTDVTGSQIKGGTNNLSAADLEYTTLGFGGIYHWDGNLKFVAYYDHVVNETVNGNAAASLNAFKNDQNDDVFTFRAQVKF